MKAYRKECLKWHPDKHVATEEAKHRAHIMFQKVNEANEILSNPQKRRTYEYTTRFSGAGGGYTRSGSAARWPYGSTYHNDDDDDDDDDDDKSV